MFEISYCSFSDEAEEPFSSLLTHTHIQMMHFQCGGFHHALHSSKIIKSRNDNIIKSFENIFFLFAHTHNFFRFRLVVVSSFAIHLTLFVCHSLYATFYIPFWIVSTFTHLILLMKWRERKKRISKQMHEDGFFRSVNAMNMNTWCV